MNDKGLRSQISELVTEKEKCEEQIEELGEELESRIKQLMVKILNLFKNTIKYNNKTLQELLSKKDEEIINYKSRIGSTVSIENQTVYLAKLQEVIMQSLLP